VGQLSALAGYLWILDMIMSAPLRLVSALEVSSISRVLTRPPCAAPAALAGALPRIGCPVVRGHLGAASRPQPKVHHGSFARLKDNL